MLTSPVGVAIRQVSGLAVGIAALAAVTVVACGSSGSGGSPKTSESSPATSAPIDSGSASAPAPAPASTRAAAGPADAATTKAIARAYATFFSSKTAVAASEVVLQHGDKFAGALADQAKNPTAASLSATVSKVVLISPSVATVTFTLLSSGKALLADTPGYAVRENGSWKVAAGTFCALLGLQGAPPAACNDTSLTALPS